MPQSPGCRLAHFVVRIVQGADEGREGIVVIASFQRADSGTADLGANIGETRKNAFGIPGAAGFGEVLDGFAAHLGICRFEPKTSQPRHKNAFPISGVNPAGTKCLCSVHQITTAVAKGARLGPRGGSPPPCCRKRQRFPCHLQRSKGSYADITTRNFPAGLPLKRRILLDYNVLRGILSSALAALYTKAAIMVAACFKSSDWMRSKTSWLE